MEVIPPGVDLTHFSPPVDDFVDPPIAVELEPFPA